MNYTKGEWKIIKPVCEPQRIVVESTLPQKDDFGNICVRTICRTLGYCDSLKEELANAHLITASPQMYEACQEAIEEMFTCELQVDEKSASRIECTRHMLEQAIAKAEGK